MNYEFPPAYPPLDDRYSLFRRVVACMPVVHQLKAGNKIESVEMLK